jgi:hypothetical protein
MNLGLLLEGEAERRLRYGWWIQRATPPWCEHVPEACSEKLYVASRHFAVAPAGTVAALVGRFTQWLLTFL